jgi:steroid delta-isomerase-like uncharacterized protein
MNLVTARTEGVRIMATALETAKATIEAFNAQDWDKLRALYAPDMVYDEKATNRRIQAPEQIIEGLQVWVTAFPEGNGTVVRELEVGDVAVLELVWKGTHTGPLQTPSGTIPASNRAVELPACEVFRVEGEKLKSATNYFDLLTLLTQIGAAGATIENRAA